MDYTTITIQGATVISIFNGRERTLGGQTSDVHIQVSVGFRNFLHTLKGARLAVFLSIALHSDEHGWSWPGRGLISRETGYNTNTISQALSELCQTRIKGHRILLRHQPQAGNGNFKTNHYLIFPSPDEIAQYEHHQPEMLLPCTAEPCTENPYTVKPCTVEPYTENLHTNKNQSEEEPTEKEETTDSLEEEPTTTTPTPVAAVDDSCLKILSSLGIMEPTRSEILALDYTTANYLQAWLDWYESQEGAGPGLIVNNIRQGIAAPLTKPKHRTVTTQKDRRRYLQWEGIQS
jgi:hypothetical protein